MSIEREVTVCAKILGVGKLILYPTDTIWGIGCDATNEVAVNKIFTLKQRVSTKSMIILMADESEVNRYVQNPDPAIFNYLNNFDNPTTVIYKRGINVAQNLLSEDGSVAIRITKDQFCKALIKQFGKPIVSTSANISGENAPALFKDISPQIENYVDYIVQHRQDDLTISNPSSIIKINDEGLIEVVRK